MSVSFMGDPWFNAMDVYPNPSDDDIIIKNDSLIHPKMISIDSMKIVN